MRLNSIVSALRSPAHQSITVTSFECDVCQKSVRFRSSDRLDAAAQKHPRDSESSSSTSVIFTIKPCALLCSCLAFQSALCTYAPLHSQKHRSEQAQVNIQCELTRNAGKADWVLSLFGSLINIHPSTLAFDPKPTHTHTFPYPYVLLSFFSFLRSPLRLSVSSVGRDPVKTLAMRSRVRARRKGYRP